MAETSLFSEQEIETLQRRPGFRAACDDAAQRSVDYFLALPGPYQWLVKDLGRAAICFTALALHSGQALTAQALVNACRDNRIASTGRVTQIIRRCEALGQMTVEPGSQFWTRRPIRVGDEFVALMKARAGVELRALAPVEPMAERVLTAIQSADGFAEFVRNAARLASQRRDVFAFAENGQIDFFMHREAGMLILYDLMCRQPAGRAALLEAAPVQRSELARRYRVSRPHINKLLSDGAGHGYLTLDGPQRAIFSPSLSSALERQFALVFLTGLHAGAPLLRDGAQAARAEARGVAAARG